MRTFSQNFGCCKFVLIYLFIKQESRRRLHSQELSRPGKILHKQGLGSRLTRSWQWHRHLRQGRLNNRRRKNWTPCTFIWILSTLYSGRQAVCFSHRVPNAYPSGDGRCSCQMPCGFRAIARRPQTAPSRPLGAATPENQVEIFRCSCLCG